MDKSIMEKEINDAIRRISRKTGIVIPVSIFHIEETPLMKSRWTVSGEYAALAQCIYLRPNIFEPIIDFEDFKANAVRMHDCSDEQIREVMHRAEQHRRDKNQKTIIHECGHYIHHRLFGLKAMRIPRQDGSSYSRTNAKENFACAFAEYILDLIPPDSKRYQKMKELLNGEGD